MADIAIKQTAAAAVPTPPAGKTAIFIDVADGLPKYKDEAGTVATFGGGLTLEQIEDSMATFLVAGTGITLTYDDAANTLTLVSSGGLTTEQVQDIVGAFVVGSSGVTATYDDPGNTLTFTIAAGAITNTMLAGSIAYSKLALTGAILNADLAGSIAYSKLSLAGAILNADLAGSIANTKLATNPLDRGNHINTQLAATISDFTAAVAAAGLTRSAVKTANFTAVAGQYHPIDTTAGAITVTLPTTPADKTVIVLKHIIQASTNTITYNTGGSDVLNKAAGATSGTLPLLAQAVGLQYDSSTAIWTIMWDDLALSQLDLRFQPLDATLTALAAVVTAASKIIYATGVDTFATSDITANALTILGHTFSQMRTDLGLVIGTNVQAWDADLDTVAGNNAGTTTWLRALLDASYLLLAGGTMTGAIAMGAHKITGVTDATAAQDAATLNNVWAYMRGAKLKSGRYYLPSNMITGIAQAPTLNSYRAAPLDIGLSGTLDRIGCRISGGAVATALERLGIHNSDANEEPTTVLLDAGTVDTSTGGAKEITISQAITPARWWIGGTGQTAQATITSIQGATSGIPLNQGHSSNLTAANIVPIGRSVAGVTGALVSFASPPVVVDQSDGSGVPAIWVRVA